MLAAYVRFGPQVLKWQMSSRELGGWGKPNECHMYSIPLSSNHERELAVAARVTLPSDVLPSTPERGA